MNAPFVVQLQAIYLKFLQRYALFRACKPFVVKGITWSHYKIHQLRAYGVFFRNTRSWPLFFSKRIVPVNDIGREVKHIIKPDEMVEVAGPQSFNGFPPGVAINATYKIHSPAIGIYEFSSAIVVGNTNFVVGYWGIAYPDVFDIEHHTCPAEVRRVISVDLQERTGRFLPPYPVRKIPHRRAISLLNQCSSNYIHWLLETLPQLTIIDQLPEYAGLPLLVDSGVHPNIAESLHLLNTTGRKVIPVALYEPVKVKSLIVLSPPGYVPYESRSIITGQPGEVRYDELHFSRTALDTLRQAAWDAVPAAVSAGPKRVYLRRQTHHRRLINADEIEALVRRFGFEIVEPETLSFRQQVSLFRNVKCIISPVGAGLGNMIFAPSGCHVISMGFFTTVPNFYFFDGIAKMLGHRHEYILGPPEDSSTTDVNHKSYRIDAHIMRELLEMVASGIGSQPEEMP